MDPQTKFQAILAGECADDLSESEATAFTEWLDAHMEAREALAAAEGELDAVCAQFEPPEPSAEAWARVDEAIRTQARQEVPAAARPAGKLQLFPLLLAATAAAAFMAAALLVLEARTPGGPDGLTSMLFGPPEPTALEDPKGVKSGGGQADSPPAPQVDLPEPPQVTRLEAGEGYRAQHLAVGDLLVINVSAAR